MTWRPPHHKTLAQSADFVTTALSFVFSYYLWISLRQVFPSTPLGADIDLFGGPFLIIIFFAATIWVMLFSLQGAYSYQRFTSFAMETKIVFKVALLGTLILLATIFLLRTGYIPRTFIVLFLLVNLALLSFEKLLMFFVAQVIRRRGQDRKTVLVAGTGNQARRFVESIREHFSLGLDIAGFLDADAKKVDQEIFGKKILGTFHDIHRVLQAYPVDEVIITVSTRRLGEVLEVLDACELEGVQVRIISDFLGKIAKGFRADMVYGLPIISINYVPEYQAALVLKRGMDVVISLIVLIALTPLFVLISAAIKFSSPGPVFYNWNVVGFNKKPFKSWKFRTMMAGADRMKAQLVPLNEMTGPVFKICNDPRVTPVGRFLRKYSLDELPQLWSVLKGDMSLVGPRPAGPHELIRYESWQRRKLSIRPGITCLWQVTGRNKIANFDDWVKLDLAYIDNWSLWLDIKILWRTFFIVIKGTGC